MKFLSDLFSKEEADVVVCGVPLGKDSVESIESLRKVSRYVEPFDLVKKRNLLEKVKVADAGDLKLSNPDEITKAVTDILNHLKVPLLLGGGHLLTLFSVKAFSNVKLIVFDAHCDLKDEYTGDKILEADSIPYMEKGMQPKFNGATWLRRYCEFVNPKNVALIGVRSCDEDELTFMEKNNVLYFTPDQIKNNMDDVKRKLKEFVGNSPIYISLDVDVFDPSIAPAVDNPEPGGLLYKEFVELLQAFGTRVEGLDVCCLRTMEGNKITEFLVVKSILQILSLL